MAELLKYWKVKFRILLLGCFISASVAAQVKNSLTGTVTSKSDGLSLPGVNVSIKTTQIGVVTDFDGKYSIDVKQGDVLEFSSIGFKTEVVIVETQQLLDVILEDDVTSLETVVVVGYGTQKQKNLTGSQTRVTAKDIQKSANN